MLCIPFTIIQRFMTVKTSSLSTFLHCVLCVYYMHCGVISLVVFYLLPYFKLHRHLSQNRNITQLNSLAGRIILACNSHR